MDSNPTNWSITKKIVVFIILQIVILIILDIILGLLFPNIKANTPPETFGVIITFWISLCLSFAILAKKFTPQDVYDFTKKFTLLYVVFGILNVIIAFIQNDFVILKTIVQIIYILSVYFFSKWFLSRKFKSQISNSV